ncbi:MAG: methionine gamma-lyase family protein [Bacillota bacterium]
MANQERVLDSFAAERVALHHMSGSTGYGYGDAGRDTLDRLYARVFGAERGPRAHSLEPQAPTPSRQPSSPSLRPGDDVLCVSGPVLRYSAAPVTGKGRPRGLRDNLPGDGLPPQVRRGTHRNGRGGSRSPVET